MKPQTTTLRIEVKQNKDIIEYLEHNVKFYSFDKHYLAIVFEDSRRAYYRLSTVLSVKEV